MDGYKSDMGMLAGRGRSDDKVMLQLFGAQVRFEARDEISEQSGGLIGSCHAVSHFLHFTVRSVSILRALAWRTNGLI